VLRPSEATRKAHNLLDLAGPTNRKESPDGSGRPVLRMGHAVNEAVFETDGYMKTKRGKRHVGSLRRTLGTMTGAIKDEAHHSRTSSVL